MPNPNTSRVTISDPNKIVALVHAGIIDTDEARDLLGYEPLTDEQQSSNTYRISLAVDGDGEVAAALDRIAECADAVTERVTNVQDALSKLSAAL